MQVFLKISVRWAKYFPLQFGRIWGILGAFKFPTEVDLDVFVTA